MTMLERFPKSGSRFFAKKHSKNKKLERLPKRLSASINIKIALIRRFFCNGTNRSHLHCQRGCDYDWKRLGAKRRENFCLDSD